MLSNALMYTTDYNRIAWCSFSAIWAPTDWKCSTWIYILWGWHKYNLSFAARFYDTYNSIVNVTDRSNCRSVMIALNNIVFLSSSLLYRCEIRFNWSPPVELRTLHRITPAENFQWFLDSKSWTIVEQLCMTTVLYRCWPVHADASSADSNRVFRCAVQPSQHPAISPGVSLSDAGYSGGTDSPGLRERHSNWNPASPCRHLQSVLNAAARSVADLRRSDHINQTLTSLH